MSCHLRPWSFLNLVAVNWGLLPQLAVRSGSPAVCQTPLIKPCNPVSPVSFLGPVLRESHLEFSYLLAFAPCRTQRHGPGGCEWSKSSGSGSQPWQVVQRPGGNLKVLPGPSLPVLSRSRWWESVLALIFVRHLLWAAEMRTSGTACLKFCPHQNHLGVGGCFLNPNCSVPHLVSFFKK